MTSKVMNHKEITLHYLIVIAEHLEQKKKVLKQKKKVQQRRTHDWRHKTKK